MNMSDFDALPPVSELVLAAGVESDLPEIERWLAELPACAFGQVFIESASALPELRAPIGVSVCRVDYFFEPGEALFSAVDAWCSEWLWAEADVDRSLLLWTSGDSASVVQGCRGRIERKIARREPSVATPVR